MQLLFSSREKQREFASKSKLKRYPVDNGKHAKSGRRWAIDISKK